MGLNDFVREAPPISVDAEDAFVDLFRKKKSATRRELTLAYIDSTGGGAPVSEFYQVLDELIEAGLLKSRSRGGETSYSLTPQGVRLHSLLDS